MATTLKIGLFQSNPLEDSDDFLISANVYCDDEKIQITDENERLVVQFSYEELCGILAIIKAERETQSLYLKNVVKRN